MLFSLETLAAVATILGTLISILALLHSRAWLVLVSLFFVGLAITAGSTPAATAVPAPPLRP
jgi:hypothetical protein